MNKPLKRLIAGLILFFLGSFVFPVLLVVWLFVYGLDKPLAQFLIPAAVDVTIERAGRYYVWNDHRTTFEGKTYAVSEEVPGDLVISLSKQDNGASLKFVSSLSIHSSVGDAERRSVGYFDVTTPGVYVLEISGPISGRVFSFSKSIFTVKTIAGLLAIGGSMMGLAFAGVVCALLGFVGLCKSKACSAGQSAPA